MTRKTGKKYNKNKLLLKTMAYFKGANVDIYYLP
jgi:hypothetical protein